MTMPIASEVHMLLMSAYKKSDTSCNHGGYEPKYISLSLLSVKEVFNKVKEHYVSDKSYEVTEDTPTTFEFNDGEWIFRYKIYTGPLNQIINYSDFEE
jgi:hypothetical protein